MFATCVAEKNTKVMKASYAALLFAKIVGCRLAVVFVVQNLLSQRVTELTVSPHLLKDRFIFDGVFSGKCNNIGSFDDE